MENIIEPTLDYNFQTLQLGLPITQPGSTYLTRVFLNNKSLYIQTPKCITRNGFVKTGKKMYCDLMFSNDDTIFINWMENLENKCQELILEKGEAWFQTAMDKSDIENAFTSPFKIYKSGKYYLLRVNVKPIIKIYNDSNNEITVENVKPEMNLISIIEVQGIKFTSRNFQIEFELKQSMIVSQDPFLEGCFIKKTQISSIAPKPIVETKIITHNSVINELQDQQPVDISQIVNNILNVKETVHPSTNIIKTDALNDTNLRVEPTKIPNEILQQTINKTQNLKPLIIQTNSLDESTELSEFDLDISLDNLETITLKKPNHVYYQMYKEVKNKANKARLEAKSAYLEAKAIKEKYMLDTDSDSDSDINSNNDTNSDESINDNSDFENENFSDNQKLNLNS
jgi:hypothetical protein